MHRSHTGAASELKAAAHLIEQGYEVFRALSPAASCDLIALMAGEVHRVEVRTGTVYPPTGHVSVSRKGVHDALIIVADDTLIVEGSLAP